MADGERKEFESLSNEVREKGRRGAELIDNLSDPGAIPEHLWDTLDLVLTAIGYPFAILSTRHMNTLVGVALSDVEAARVAGKMDVMLAAPAKFEEAVKKIVVDNDDFKHLAFNALVTAYILGAINGVSESSEVVKALRGGKGGTQ